MLIFFLYFFFDSPVLFSTANSKVAVIFFLYFLLTGFSLKLVAFGMPGRPWRAPALTIGAFQKGFNQTIVFFRMPGRPWRAPALKIGTF